MSIEDKNLNIIVESHRIARERVMGGKPPWAHIIPIKDCLTKQEDLTVEQYRAIGKSVAKMLRARLPANMFSYQSEDCDHELIDIVEIFEDISSLDENENPDPNVSKEDLNNAMSSLYDWGDINRVFFSGTMASRYEMVFGVLHANQLDSNTDIQPGA
jgi:hypothetical protein